MKIVDPHHHLWDRRANSYPWLATPKDHPFLGSTEGLCQDYLPADFAADRSSLPTGQEIVKSVHLQAEIDHVDALEETRWLQAIADEPGSGGFPHGIVAFADLSDPAVERLLEAHASFANCRGIRHILNRHPHAPWNMAERDFMTDAQWRQGFGLLRRYGLSFDIQVYPGQMAEAAGLARDFPDTQFILNHTGMPIDRDEAGIERWRSGMSLLAACPNIVAKISGFGMVDHGWTVDSLRPFVMRTIDLFGVARCAFASNFPVDRLFRSYAKTWQAFCTLMQGFSSDEQAALFHDTAVRIYRL